MGELQADLQRLSGTDLDAQGAANVWAGTSGRDLVGALNARAGTSGLELAGALRACGGSGDPNAALAAVRSLRDEAVWWIDARFGPTDLSGNGLHPTVNGAVLLEPFASHWSGPNEAFAATTPDAASLDLTAGFCVAVDVQPPSWQPATPQQILSKPTGTNADTFDCYTVGFDPSGHPFIEWDDTVAGHNGPAFLTVNGADADVTFSGSGRKQLVWEFIGDNGAGGWTARIYSGGPGATTLLSEIVNTTDGAQTLSTSTQALRICDPMAGQVFRVRLYDSLGGTLLADFNPADDYSMGSTMTAATGEIWSGVLVPTRAGWGVAEGATMSVADDPLLDIGAADSATVFALVSTADADGTAFQPIVSKAVAGTGWLMAFLNALGGAAGGLYVAGTPSVDAGPAASDGLVSVVTRIDRGADTVETAVGGVLSGSPTDVAAVGDVSNAGDVVIGAVPVASVYATSMIVHAIGKINRALTDDEVTLLQYHMGAIDL